MVKKSSNKKKIKKRAKSGQKLTVWTSTSVSKDCIKCVIRNKARGRACWSEACQQVNQGHDALHKTPLITPQTTLGLGLINYLG